MRKNILERVDIVLRAKPDYRRPDPDAGIEGFVLDWGENHVEFWAEDPKDFVWDHKRKRYDSHRMFEEFHKLAHGRSKVGKIFKPAFKHAEKEHWPIYLNGVRCTEIEAILIETQPLEVPEETTNAAAIG